MIVAIDGPAGAGKSTVARRLAARLGCGYLNTGSMYRALTLLAVRTGTAFDDTAALAELVRRHRIALEPGLPAERVTIDGEDVTEAVRAREITAAVSSVAAHRQVRVEIVAAQRAVMASGDWVADGRDIGSVVCPDAELKIYLTADAQERARRRQAELAAGGEDVALGDVLQDLVERDGRDTNRAESPLVVADGAVVVDTSGMSIDQVVDHLVQLAKGGPT